MTAQVVLVGDIHAMDRPPASVNESYMDDIIAMLRWVAEEAQRRGIKVAVWAGDIFHYKQPSRTSHALVLRLIEVIRYYESLGVEVWIVVGNHDVTNDRVESVKDKQPLGLLLESGARELNGWHPELPIFGVPWQQRWLEEDAPREAFWDWRVAGGDPEYRRNLAQSLAVTHAPIYPPGEAEKQLFDLVPTKGEHGLSAAMGNQGYLYYGHIHEDHGVFDVEGVTYCNPGAISRGSLHDYNLDRQIKMATWGSEEGFSQVVIPHRPAEEVFKIEAAQEAKAEKISLDAFLSEVGATTIAINSTASVIEHIRGMQHVEPNVRKTAIEILEEVS